MAPPTPDEDIWSFNPNRIAPIVFAALFTASGCHHVWQAQYGSLHTRHPPPQSTQLIKYSSSHYASYTLTLPIPLGALLYTAGLATRSASAFHPSNEGLVIASGVLVLDATYTFPSPVPPKPNHALTAPAPSQPRQITSPSAAPCTTSPPAPRSRPLAQGRRSFSWTG